MDYFLHLSKFINKKFDDILIIKIVNRNFSKNLHIFLNNIKLILKLLFFHIYFFL
jgi:hypothetical protein